MTRLCLTKWFFAAACVFVPIAGPVSAQPAGAGLDVRHESVTVFAAASLTNALREAADRLTAAGGLRVRCSFAGSSSLARQIEQGARADVYVSANAQWMDYLSTRGLIEPDSRFNWLENRLVVVAPIGEGFVLRVEKDFDFAGSFRGRLAVADPDHVPAGMYARQALSSLGWWRTVADRLAPAMDVRGALAYVERGACPAGVVYATDAAASAGVVVLAEIPSWAHDTIVYPVAAVKGRDGPQVRQLLDFLRSDAAMQILRRHGFGAAPSEDTHAAVDP